MTAPPLGDGAHGARTKVAILGGGPGSLSAAYYLTSLEPDKYDITIYEMSWRLGGKTTSGRDEHGRIQEHGLHVLFGGYHNAFDMMLGCYDALRTECGPDAIPFSSFLDALAPGDFGVIGDDRYRRWRRMDLQFPVNRGVPGDPPLPTTWDILSGVFQIILHVLFGGWLLRRLLQMGGGFVGYRRRFPRGRRRARDLPGDGGDRFVNEVIIPLALAALDDERWLGRLAMTAVRAMHRFVRAVGPIARSRVLRDRLPGRAWTAADLVLATVRGLSADRVFFRPDGYARLDELDLRDWLRRYDTHERTLGSPLVRIIYDAAFSYPEGGRVRDEQGHMQESVAAGAALRIIMWMAFTYKGAMYYKMRAGMGDVISAPLYRLLRKRGVKFEFFHKVKALIPGEVAGRHVVEAVELQQLARPADADGYDPFIRCGSLDCWPVKPVLDRINPADHDNALHAEEFFHTAKNARRVVLAWRGAGPPDPRGRPPDDVFDQIIFGIPVGCVPYLCSPLVERGKWALQSQVESTQTVALQIWSKHSLPELGWRAPPPLLSLFWDPLNTWSDMGQVLEQEGWPEGERPPTLAYFCGPLPHEWPGLERERVDPAVDRRWRAMLDTQAAQARDDLLSRLRELWPMTGAPGRHGAAPVFNWNILHDPLNRKGAARLEAQYLRANFDPHERCTLALPGQSAHRIPADDTGYENLTVAGDWTANDVLLACFEGTVQSGIRAARAVSQQKDLYRIIGERLLNPGATFGRRPSRRDPADAAGPAWAQDHGRGGAWRKTRVDGRRSRQVSRPEAPVDRPAEDPTRPPGGDPGRRPLN